MAIILSGNFEGRCYFAVLSLCFTPEIQSLSSIYTCIIHPGFRYDAPGFVAATQRTHFDHVVLVARNVCIPESRRTMIIRETVLGRLIALYRQQTRARSPSHSLKSFFAYLVADGATLKEHGQWTPSLCSPSTLPQLIDDCQKTIYVLIWHSVFTIATQGIPPDYQALVASGAYACSPTGLYIFAYI